MAGMAEGGRIVRASAARLPSGDVQVTIAGDRSVGGTSELKLLGGAGAPTLRYDGAFVDALEAGGKDARRTLFIGANRLNVSAYAGVRRQIAQVLARHGMGERYEVTFERTPPKVEVDPSLLLRIAGIGALGSTAIEQALAQLRLKPFPSYELGTRGAIDLLVADATDLDAVEHLPTRLLLAITAPGTNVGEVAAAAPNARSIITIPTAGGAKTSGPAFDAAVQAITRAAQAMNEGRRVEQIAEATEVPDRPTATEEGGALLRSHPDALADFTLARQEHLLRTTLRGRPGIALDMWPNLTPDDAQLGVERFLDRVHRVVSDEPDDLIEVQHAVEDAREEDDDLHQGRRRVDVALRRWDRPDDAAEPLVPDLLDPVPQTVTTARGRAYALTLRIATRRLPGSIVVGAAPPIDDLLPESDRGHDLEVACFTDGGLELTGPTILPLHLPPQGASDEVSFGLVPTALGAQWLRIGIYLDGNLVQTFRFTTEVRATEEHADANVTVVFIDHSQTADWSDLAEVTPRDMSIVLNATTTGHGRMVKIAEAAWFEHLPPSYDAQLVQPIRRLLQQNVDGKDHERTVRELAGLGYELFDALFHTTRDLRDDVRDLRTRPAGVRIQVTHVDPNRTLPWAAVYEWKVPPGTPAVCWGTTKGGQPCGHSKDPGVVCVRGFWGVNHQLDEVVQESGAAPPAIPKLPGRPVVGFSHQSPTPATKALEHDLGRLWTGQGVRTLKGTDSLLDLMFDAAARPPLILLLGHGDQGSIEVVTSERKITPRELSERALDDGDWEQAPRSLVLLMACDSTNTTPDDLVSFVRVLQPIGAAAVIGVDAEVRTDVVAWFVGALCAGLAGTGQEARLGAAVQRARQDLVIERKDARGFSFSVLGHAEVRLAS